MDPERDADVLPASSGPDALQTGRPGTEPVPAEGGPEHMGATGLKHAGAARFHPLQNEWLAKLIWPVAGLALLLLFNFLFTENFFRIEVRDGRLYGVLIDVLNHGSKVMLLALGMSLVIATGGVDLSVGAVMAISGAVAAQLINMAGVPFPLVIGGALAAALVAGCWNGMLVGVFRIQPIVATLILMVAGRGIAQLITGGQIITFTDTRLTYLGNGHLFGLPFPITIVLVMLGLTALLTRKTALGLFIESVGDNERASFYAGLNARTIKFMTYVFSGLCAGMAGLVAASNIKCADSNHAGLFLELDAILAVVVGGTALTGGRFYLVGAIVGALLIQTLTTTMYMRDVSADVAPVPKAVVIIIVCLLQSAAFRAKVTGLFGRRAA